MASVTFTRLSETEIYYSITGAYYGTSYSYEVQAQNNDTKEWKWKGNPSISSNGKASGTFQVNNNSGYYCRVVEYYNDSVSAHIPGRSGSYVGSYSQPTTSYAGFIAGYTIEGYTGSSSKPYQGEVELQISITEGARTGWTIRVLNPDTGNAPIKVTLSMGGYYTIYLDNLYDGKTAQNYTIYLYDPDGEQQDYRYIRHRDTPTVKHTLTYDANGGSGAPSRQTETVVAWDDPHYFTVSYTEPSRDGYIFLGWSTSSTASTASYKGGSSIGVSGQTTLYAVWEKGYQALVPNITALTFSGVSASGFTVSATQNNLEAGYWRIEISTSSSFSSITASSSVSYSQRTMSAEFSGLSSNTRYYVRVRNYYDGDMEYATGWSRYTGIVPFQWTSNDAAQVVAGAEFSDVITASAWNTLGDKISAVSRRRGAGSVTLATVYSGTTALTAAIFNDARNTIAALSGAGSVPDTVDAGDAVLSAQFANATASLKSAINRAISALNN